MPEVAEQCLLTKWVQVSHICALLRRNIIGSRVINANINNDPLLFPVLKNHKHPESEITKIRQLLSGSIVEKVGRHGKYFWIRFEGGKVMLMHFGMTGMIHLKGVQSHLVFMENGGDKGILAEKAKENEDKEKEKEKQGVQKGSRKSKYFKPEVKQKKIDSVDESWPPRFNKMDLHLNNGKDILLSFADARRLGRIRFLTNITNELEMFNIEPLIRQGPDYSKPSDFLLDDSKPVSDTFQFGDPDPINYIPQYSQSDFNQLILLKKKPIKSLLLEQEYFAGVGNWVSDEILYQAKIHPQEILSEKVTVTSPYLTNLYNSLKMVCSTAVQVEGDVKQFPEHWMMIYRWGKRRKKQEKPKVNGSVIDFVTVGGRTSCYVPEVQRKIPKSK